MDEIAEVHCNGSIYRDWTGVEVTWKIGSPPRVFRLTLTELSEGTKAYSALRLKPGDRCTIKLAGEIAIEDGFIEERQPAYDAERHGVQIAGVSRSDLLVTSSAEVKGGQFQKQSFSAIAAAVLQPVGLSFRMANAPAGADRPFGRVAIQHGETIFEFLERLSRFRGIWLTGDEKGNLIGGVPDSGGPVMLTEGIDILSARAVMCDRELPEKNWVRGQTYGSDEASGKRVSQVSAFATNPNGRAGKTQILIAEEPIDQHDAKQRVEHEVRAQIGTSVSVTVTRQGWLRPDGKLWKPGDKVTVKSPMLFPNEDGTQALQVLAVAFSQSEAGTTTSLDLVLEGMFAELSGTGNQASQDFFKPRPSAGQPET